jgi:hypothetical protein
MKEGRAAFAGTNRNAYRVLEWKPYETRHSQKLSVEGRIITTDLKEIGWDDEEWTHLATG